MEITLFLAASAAANRFVEAIKPTVRKLPYSVDVQNAFLTLVAVGAGIIVCFLGQLNLFTAVPNIPEIAAVVLTGVLCGLGADAINAVFGLLYNWKDATKPADPPQV